MGPWSLPSLPPAQGAGLAAFGFWFFGGRHGDLIQALLYGEKVNLSFFPFNEVPELS